MRTPLLASFLALLVLCPAALGQDPVEQTPLEKWIFNTLATRKTDVDFEDTPVKAVFAFLRQKGGVNLVVDPSVLETLESSGVVVDLKLKDVSVLDVLRIVCRFNELEMVVNNRVLFITTREGARGNPRLKLFDVRNLVRPRRYEPGQVRDLFFAFGDDSVRAPHFPDDVRDEGICAEDLCCFLQEAVDPDSWDGTYAVTVVQGCLLIKQSRRALREIQGILSDLEQARKPAVLLRGRILLVRREALAGVQAGTALEADSLAKLVAAAEGLSQPFGEVRVSCLNTERVNLTTGRTESFPSGHDAAGESYCQVRDGVVLDVQPLYVGGPGVPCIVRVFAGRFDSTAGTLPRMAFLRTETLVTLSADRPVAVAAGSVPLAGKPAGLVVLLSAELGSRNRRQGRRDEGREGDGALRAKLAETKVTVDFKDVPLHKALRKIAADAGVNIVVLPEVYEEKGEDELKIQLQVANIPVKSVLNLICSLRGLVYTVRTGVVHVGTDDEISTYGSQLRVFPVHDLVVNPRLTFNAPMATFPHLGKMPDQNWGDEDESEHLTLETVENLLRETVSPESWDTPPNLISGRVGSLNVRNMPRVLDGVSRLLGDLRDRLWKRLSVEGAFVRLPASWFDAHGVRGPALAPSLCDKLDKTLAASPALVVTRFSSTGVLGQPFTIAGGRQLTHVDAYVSEEDHGVSAALDGWFFRALAVGTPSPGRVEMGVKAMTSSYRAPARPACEAGSHLTQAYRLNLCLSRGGGAILGGGQAGTGEGSKVYLYLRVR